MNPRIDRRTFLVGAPGALLAAPASRTRAQGANNRIVVGIMGTGSRGLDHARAFQAQPNVEIAYVCDPDAGRAEAAASAVEKGGGRRPKAVGDYRRILDDKSVDVLSVATCNHWHAPASIAACAAGKHVYVEKPCSHNPWEGEAMVAAARKHDRRVQMGNQRRSSRVITEAIELVRSGEIGKVTYAQAWYTNSRGSIGRGESKAPPEGLDFDLWQGPAPRRPFKSNILHYNWHWFWHWGNGELGNNGVHMIDLCRWGLGVDFPERVSSIGGRYRFDDDQQTPDTNMVTFTFPGGKMISWEGLSCSQHPSRPNRDVVFHGENGSIALFGGGYSVHDPAGKEIKRATGTGGDKEHFANFLDAVRSAAKLTSEIEVGHRSTLLCHLGNISWRTGRTLHCDAKSGRINNDRDAMKLWKREYEPGWEPKG